jgi:hypothetical protein
MARGQDGLLHNQWQHGSRQWNVGLPPGLDRGKAGVLPLRTVLDPEVGPETILCLIDPTPFIHQVAALKPFTLQLKAGIAETDSGPVLFLLYWLPGPVGSPEPFAIYEMTLNPHDPTVLAPYRELAHQTHWHLCILGPNDEVLNIYEFENTFGTSEILVAADHVASRLSCVDFAAAKREYEETYSLEELLHM